MKLLVSSILVIFMIQTIVFHVSCAPGGNEELSETMGYWRNDLGILDTLRGNEGIFGSPDLMRILNAEPDVIESEDFLDIIAAFEGYNRRL